jgi:bacillolysin
MNCPKCNYELSGNEKFCPKCGAKIYIKSNKKKILILLSFLIILISFFLFIYYKWTLFTDNYSNVSSSDLISYSYDDKNNLKFIDGKFSNINVSDSNDVLTAIDLIKDKIGINDTSKELKLFSNEESNNITFYKYHQFYNDINVIYQDVVVSVDNKGNILSYSGYYLPDINIDTVPQKSSEDINTIALQYLGSNSKIVSNDLCIWAYNNVPTLSYHITGYSDNNALDIMIDANSGKILSKGSLFESDTNFQYNGVGLDETEYTINLDEYEDLSKSNNKLYKFYDMDRNIIITDYRNIGAIFGNLFEPIIGESPISVAIKDGKIDSSDIGDDFTKNAISTMANYEKIYDYYKNVLNRNSYDNKGSKIVVHLGVSATTFTDKDLNNAFWSMLEDQMYIGNYHGKSFSASLDVLAHEFTHGVVEKTASFAGYPKEENTAFETGALNEGYADIMGSLIEGKNWTMGENNIVIRNASNPNSLKDPDTKDGKYYYPNGYLKDDLTLEQFLKDNKLEKVTDYDLGGVHDNSNVFSHAAYLMFTSGAFSDREEMAKVFYNSLYLLSSYSDFEDAALAIIKTAKNFGLSTDSISKITQAFYDTNILVQKKYKINGIVKSGKVPLNNVIINIYSADDNEPTLTTNSNDNGEYNVELPSGNYKIEFIKNGFNNYSKDIIINADTILNVNMSKQSNKKDTLTSECQYAKCYNLRIYYLVDNNNKFEEQYDTIAVEADKVIGTDTLINTINGLNGSSILSSDGKSFYYNINGEKFEFAWYYKDTDTVFDWNEPISQDVDLEMKMLNGDIDNKTIIDINDLFN